jgi:hypothetical protein
MPALAPLLILVGYPTITPADLVSVWKTGKMLAATLGATMLVSFDQALLVGVGLFVVLDMIHDGLRVGES